MKKSFVCLGIILFLSSCSFHAAKHPTEGSWGSTIDDVDIALEVIVVGDTVVTGGMKVLMDSRHEIKEGMQLRIIEGSLKDSTISITLDVDMNGKKSEEDIFMELYLEDNETLKGYGYEVDNEKDKHDVVFTRKIAEKGHR
jgi:hypothetical protein